MITSPYLYAVILGVVAGGVVYLALSGFRQDAETRHLLRVMSVGIGAAAIWWGIDGRWIAVEANLGHSRVEEGAHNLLAMRGKLTEQANAACSVSLPLIARRLCAPSSTRL
jgi:hypothetical protein